LLPRWKSASIGLRLRFSTTTTRDDRGRSFSGVLKLLPVDGGVEVCPGAGRG